MTQGESVREEVKARILKIAGDDKDHLSKDFTEEHARNNARQSVYKYLKEMRKVDHTLNIVLDEDLQHRYHITEKGKRRLAEIKVKEQFSSELDSCTRKELEQMVATFTNQKEWWKRVAGMHMEELRKLRGPVKFSYEEQAAKVAKAPASFRSMYKRLKRDLNQPQQEPSKSKEKGPKKQDPS